MERESQNTTPCKGEHHLTDLRETGVGEKSVNRDGEIGETNIRDSVVTSVSKSLLVRKLSFPALKTMSLLVSSLPVWEYSH